MTVHLSQRSFDDDSNASASDEILTSYLDGELPLPEQRHLEMRLAKDANLRLRLAELRQAYDLLDDLPETPHDQRFTQSTIEHVVQAVKLDKEQANRALTSPARGTWSRWRLRFPVILLCCALGGTAAGFVARHFSIKEEIENFSLVANLNGLQVVSDIEVARALSQDSVAMETLKERFARRFYENVPTETFARPQWVDSLTPLQKSEIFRNRETYTKLSEEQLSKLRQINSQILGDESSEQLQEAVRLVGLVVERLHPSDRLPLMGMTSEERIVYLREKVYFFAADHYFSNAIDEKDAQAIDQWFDVARYKMALQLGFFRSNRSRAFHGELTPEQKESLINLYSENLLSQLPTRDDDQVATVLEDLHKNLTEKAQTLLAGLNATEQLLVLFTYLAPNRIGSDGHFIDRYINASPQFKELLDLSSPAEVRSMILQEPRRPTR